MKRGNRGLKRLQGSGSTSTTAAPAAAGTGSRRAGRTRRVEVVRVGTRRSPRLSGGSSSSSSTATSNSTSSDAGSGSGTPPPPSPPVREQEEGQAISGGGDGSGVPPPHSAAVPSADLAGVVLGRAPLNQNIQEPWRTRVEFNELCEALRENRYDEALALLNVWFSRQPLIPLACEVTMMYLEAKKLESLCGVVALKSVYSGAIVRWINYAGRMAAGNRGEISLQATKELLAPLGIPEWIVALRNEVNHGVNLPSIQSLQNAMECMINWLMEFYWKPVEDEWVDEPTHAEIFIISGVFSSYIAARVQQLRQIPIITMKEILKHLKGSGLGGRSRISLQTNVALHELEIKIGDILARSKYPETVYEVVAEIMIIEKEMYDELPNVFPECDPFESLQLFWSPIIQWIIFAQDLPKLLTALVSLHAEEDHFSGPESEWRIKLSSQWIHVLLRHIPLMRPLIGSTMVYMKMLEIVTPRLKIDTVLFYQQLLNLVEREFPSVAARCKALASATLKVHIDRRQLVEQSVRRQFTVEEAYAIIQSIEDDAIRRRERAAMVNNGAAAAGVNGAPGVRRDPRGVPFWRCMPFGAVL